jgi:membrane protease subunit HflK
MAYPLPKWPQNLKLRGKQAIIAAIVAILAVLGANSFYSVDQAEQAVITRFGHYRGTVGAGLHLKLPWIDRCYIVAGPEVIQTEQFGFHILQGGVVNQYRNNIVTESTMLTGDLNIVDVEWTIQFRITDPVAWLFNVQDQRKTIRDISQSVVNMLVGDRAILDVMRLERGPIETAAIELMNENFQQLGLGIRVRTVNLQNVRPPQGVQAAFDDVNKSTQDMERLTNEGQEAYNAQIPRARGEAARLIQQADGYAIERVNKARGDVSRFNAVYLEYRAAPAITRQRLYLETMEALFAAGKQQTLIDSELDNVIPIKNLTGPSAGTQGGR